MTDTLTPRINTPTSATAHISTVVDGVSPVLDGRPCKSHFRPEFTKDEIDRVLSFLRAQPDETAPLDDIIEQCGLEKPRNGLPTAVCLAMSIAGMARHRVYRPGEEEHFGHWHFDPLCGSFTVNLDGSHVKDEDPSWLIELVVSTGARHD